MSGDGCGSDQAGCWVWEGGIGRRTGYDTAAGDARKFP